MSPSQGERRGFESHHPLLSLVECQIIWHSTFMLQWDGKKRSLELVEFEMEKAIASVVEGKPVIPVWLNEIYQRLEAKLVV